MAVQEELFAHHGGGVPRGASQVVRSSLDHGRYGRMFRHLKPLRLGDDELAAYAESMVPHGTPPASSMAAVLEPGENPDLPSGYTYLGQLVDHDVTFDSASSLDRRNDPDALWSFRTPRLDLDCVYGSGPDDSPFLYDQEDRVKLLVGRNRDESNETEDLPRNQQGRALIGDPRNDVHVIIAQLHLALIRFHNAVVDHLRARSYPEDGLWDEAQRLTRWHYQWVVVDDFLRPLVGSDVLDHVLVTDPASGDRKANLEFFKWKRAPFVPVEFSAAAYRVGHSQVRSRYRLNPTGELLHILHPDPGANPLEHLGGFRPLPGGWKIRWDLFFPIAGSTPQLSRRIDTNLTGPFAHLPATVDRERRPLALLDLMRGRALGLPSGQAVAAAMGTTLPDEQLHLTGETPLWYYLLREAEVLTEGRRLGPTGARIVAEVLIGFLHGDPASFLRQAPGWVPELPSEEPGHFTIGDVLRFAGVA